MTQTIRRKDCKTWRERAGNNVSDAQRRHPKLSMVEIAGLVAEAEHARAVRICKRLEANALAKQEPDCTRCYLEGVRAVLAALTKGRA